MNEIERSESECMSRFVDECAFFSCRFNVLVECFSRFLFLISDVKPCQAATGIVCSLLFNHPAFFICACGSTFFGQGNVGFSA